MLFPQPLDFYLWSNIIEVLKKKEKKREKFLFIFIFISISSQLLTVDLQTDFLKKNLRL